MLKFSLFKACSKLIDKELSQSLVISSCSGERLGSPHTLSVDSENRAALQDILILYRDPAS